jgi:hypothetical protein
MPAFKATFADGYVRTIAHPKIKNLKAATAYAKSLESWFSDGNYSGRTLVSVTTK